LINHDRHCVTSWTGIARLVRESFESKNEEYVIAAHTMGLKDRHIIFRHILPFHSPVLVSATFGIAVPFLLKQL